MENRGITHDSFMETGLFFTAILYGPARVKRSQRAGKEVADEVSLAPLERPSGLPATGSHLSMSTQPQATSP